MLKEKIESLYNEYVELDKIVKEKNQEVVKKKNSLKEGSIEQLGDILSNMYVDSILQNKDLQILFAKLITAIDFHKELLAEEKLKEEIEKFYEEMRYWMPKRTFIVEKGELKETEEGLLAEERKKFLEGDYFKQLQQQLTTASK